MTMLRTSFAGLVLAILPFTQSAGTILGSLARGPLVISEIRVDQPGSDHDEYFELMGRPGDSLDGLTYVVLGDGAMGSGEVEAIVQLDGQTLGPDGVFLVTESSHAHAETADFVAPLEFVNNDNKTHLLVAGFAGRVGDDLDVDDDCVLDVRPWVEVVDAVALIVEDNPPTSTECHYGTLGVAVGPDGSFAPGHVYRCDGWNIGGFSVGDQDSPGAPNADCPVSTSWQTWGIIGSRF